MKILGTQDWIRAIDWNDTTVVVLIGTEGDPNEYEAKAQLSTDGARALRDRLTEIIDVQEHRQGNGVACPTVDDTDDEDTIEFLKRMDNEEHF